MKPRIFHVVAVCTVVLFLRGGGFAGAAEPSVVLKPKYEAGRVEYVELAEELEQTMKGGQFGEGRTSKRQSVRTVMQKVEAAPASGGARLTLTFDRLQMALQQGPQNTSFDTDADDLKDKTKPNAASLGPMVGMSFTMEVGADGQALAVHGMSDIFDKVEESGGSGRVFEELRDVLNDEAGKVTWGDARHVLFSGKEVKAGDIWTRTVRQRSYYLGNLVSEYKFKVERVGEEAGRKVAVVSYGGTMGVDPGGPPPSVGIMGTRSSFQSGKFEGEATFDIERGAFTKQVETFQNRIDAKMPVMATSEVADVKTEQSLKRTITILSESDRKKQRQENREKAELTKKEEEQKKKEEEAKKGS